MATVVVTGASGFIGTALCAELKKSDCAVIPAKRDALPSAPGAACVHLAASSDPADIERRPDEHLREGLELARRVLAAGYGRIVYVSSSHVYGDAVEAPRAETETPAPSNAYGRLKLSLEGLFQGPGRTIARVANVYGPGMSPINVFSHIAAQLGTGQPVRVRNLVSARDYIHVEDAAAALRTLALGKLDGVFNVGTGRGTRVDELIRLLAAARGLPEPAMEAPEWKGGPSSLVLDPSKLRRETGFEPRVRLEQGLGALYA